MQNQSTVLKMTSYSVVNFKYEINENFTSDENNIPIPFNFGTEFKKVDENNLIAKFTVVIADAEKFPFKLELTIQSSFMSHNWEAQANQAELTIASILFPYVRALITSLTSLAGEQPIILPVMNVAELIKNQQRQ